MQPPHISRTAGRLGPWSLIAFQFSLFGFHLSLFSLLPPAPAAAQVPKPAEKTDEVKTLDAPGAALRKRVERLLGQGKVEDALKAVADAVLARGTPGERREYVDLHMSIARHLIRIDDFRRAEELLHKALQVEATNAEALTALREIDRARATTPHMIERAGQFAKVERWGAAARIYAKAIALLTEREPEWKPLLMEARAEAADQHYRLGNWAEAVFHYQTAGGELDDVRRMRRVAAIVFHAAGLLRQGRIAEPVWADYVKGAAAILQKQPDKPLATMLIGLGQENAGKFDEAVAAYSAVAGEAKPPEPGKRSAADAARARTAAVEALRKSVARVTADNRPRMWQETLPGEPLVRETDRFRIFHHNDRVARRVADALEFYLVEVVNDWKVPIDKVLAWRPKIDVHLYRNEAEFREKTGMVGFVPGFSKKPKPGAPLLEHSIHTFQNHPGLLSSILPHELTHLVLAYVSNYPKMPTALDEALALASEPDYMQSAYRRIAAEPAVRAATPTLEQLLGDVKSISGADYTVFYARNLVLADLIRGRAPPGKVLAMLAKLPAAGGDLRPALAAATGYKDAAELEAAWQVMWGR